MIPPLPQDAQGLEFHPIPFDVLDGFAEDEHAEAFRVFQRSCAATVEKARCLRQAAPASAAFVALCRRALSLEISQRAQAQHFFETHFRPCRVSARGVPGPARGFLTGSYEPVVAGSLTRSRKYNAPILAPLPGLETASREKTRAPGGRSCPDRPTIEALAEDGRATPIVFLRDWVEVFFIQIQGSARVHLEDGRRFRLVYAGRNGWPYTSIGKILIETGTIAPADMSLARIKQWIRDNGQEPGEPGLQLMHRNKSYVFFRLAEDRDPAAGPLGGQGIPLTALRSIAVDRSLWTYGLPIWISGNLPWQGNALSPFRRLMIAQDTGTAITGPARADIFFGSGEEAGTRAGNIRHDGDFIVLMPKLESLGP